MPKLRVSSVFALASLALVSPSLAAPTYVSTSTTIGNNTTIVRSGGTTTVSSSQSCSPGVTGSFYQSVMILFGGSVVNVTQAATCH
jgi:hypothetical protein